jgi:hypothetical protein
MTKLFSLKNIVVRNLVTRREFKYSKNNCNLNFTLDIDKKDEIKDFRQCLVEAMKDMDELLN